MTSLTIVVAAILVLFALAAYAYRALRESASDPIEAVDHSQKSKQSYTVEEIRKHNRADDCWLIIKSKVYDVTPYVEEHPGGESILKHAGGDATEGFFGPQHPPRVFDLVDDFMIGQLARLDG